MHPGKALYVILPVAFALLLAGCTGIKIVPLTNSTTLEPGSLVSAGEYTITLATVGEIAPGVNGATFAASSGSNLATKTIAEGKRGVLFDGDLAITVKSVSGISATVSVEAGLRAAKETRPETTPAEYGDVHGDQYVVVDTGQEAACGEYKVKVITINDNGVADVIIFHSSGQSEIVKVELGAWQRAFDGDVAVGVKKSSQYNEIARQHVERAREFRNAARDLHSVDEGSGTGSINDIAGSTGGGGVSADIGSSGGGGGGVSADIGSGAPTRVAHGVVGEGRIILGVRCGVKGQGLENIPRTEEGIKLSKGSTVSVFDEKLKLTYLEFGGSSDNPIIVLRVETADGSEGKRIALHNKETFLKKWVVFLKYADRETAVVVLSRFYYEEPKPIPPTEETQYLESQYFNAPFDGSTVSLQPDGVFYCGTQPEYKVYVRNLFRASEKEPGVALHVAEGVLGDKGVVEHEVKLTAGNEQSFFDGALKVFVNGIVMFREHEGKTALTISCKRGEETPTGCTEEYSPVCGYDRFTYSNECHASEKGVEVAYKGKCGPTACTADYKPVCGTDGRTYSNDCAARTSYAHVAYEGECASQNARQLVGEGSGTYRFTSGAYATCDTWKASYMKSADGIGVFEVASLTGRGATQVELTTTNPEYILSDFSIKLVDASSDAATAAISCSKEAATSGTTTIKPGGAIACLGYQVRLNKAYAGVDNNLASVTVEHTSPGATPETNEEMIQGRTYYFYGTTVKVIPLSVTLDPESATLEYSCS